MTAGLLHDSLFDTQMSTISIPLCNAVQATGRARWKAADRERQPFVQAVFAAEDYVAPMRYMGGEAV